MTEKDWFDGENELPVNRGKFIDEIEIEYQNDLGTFHAVGLYAETADREPVFLEVLTGTKIDWAKTVRRWRYYAGD